MNNLLCSVRMQLRKRQTQTLAWNINFCLSVLWTTLQLKRDRSNKRNLYTDMYITENKEMDKS